MSETLKLHDIVARRDNRGIWWIDEASTGHCELKGMCVVFLGTPDGGAMIHKPGGVSYFRASTVIDDQSNFMLIGHSTTRPDADAVLAAATLLGAFDA